MQSTKLININRGGYIAGKVPHRYIVQEGDATMLTKDSLPGQKI